MNFVFRMLCLSAFGVGTVSAAPAEERIWTGTNGKTFRGTFITLEEKGTKAVFFTSGGQQVIVAVENLIPADRNLLHVPIPAPRPADKQAPVTAKPAVVAPVTVPARPMDAGPGFAKLPKVNRALIPTISPKSLGIRDYEAIVDAIWVSLLWWEKAMVLEVPGRGDFEKRAGGLHEDLSREIARGGNSSATLEEALEGVETYFKKQLKDTATCRTKILKNVSSVAELASTITEGRAVVIKMTMKYDKERNFSTAASLESLTPDGKFVMHMFGVRLHGVVKVDANGVMEWVVNNRDAMPEYYQSQGATFHLNDNSWNGVLMIDPYVYATKGKPAPLPPEEQIKPTAPDKPDI